MDITTTRTPKKLSNNTTQQYSSQKEINQTKLFIGCLPQKISRKDIKDYFSKYGNIEKIHLEIKKTADCHSHLINACLTCSSKAMAQKILAYKPHNIQGCNLKVVPYMEESDLEKHINSFRRRRLYLNHLPMVLSNEELFEVFSQYGQVNKAYTVPEKKKKCNWKKGYVIFEDKESLKQIPEEGVYWNGIILNWHSYESKAKVRCQKKNKKKVKKEKILRKLNQNERGAQGYWFNNLPLEPLSGFNQVFPLNNALKTYPQNFMNFEQKYDKRRSWSNENNWLSSQTYQNAPNISKGYNLIEKRPTMPQWPELRSWESDMPLSSHQVDHCVKPTNKAYYTASEKCYQHNCRNLVLNRVIPLVRSQIPAGSIRSSCRQMRGPRNFSF